MALVQCKECSNQISEYAKVCPHCGIDLLPQITSKQSPPKAKAKGINWWVILSVIFVCFMAAGVYDILMFPVVEKVQPKAYKPVVTMAKYNRIEVGMSQEVVISIIGTKGVEEARSYMEGVPGVMKSIETIIVAWTNKDGSNMNIIFQNNVVFQKAQFGLK